jgi:hypothetical protein
MVAGVRDQYTDGPTGWPSGFAIAERGSPGDEEQSESDQKQDAEEQIVELIGRRAQAPMPRRPSGFFEKRRRQNHSGNQIQNNARLHRRASHGKTQQKRDNENNGHQQRGDGVSEQNVGHKLTKR